MQKLLIFVVILAGAFILLITIPSWLPFGKGTEAALTKDIDLIQLDVSGISTIIIPENRSNLVAELDGKGQVEVKEEGDSIKIEYKRNWFQTFSFFNNPKLFVYIPEDYNRDIDLEVGSGNIDFKGNTDFHINHLSMDVSSGNITIDALTTKKSVMDVRSGNIDLKHHVGQIEADVSSGNLLIQMDELNDSVKLDVNSGHVKLDIPEDANFTLDGEVNSGFISNHFELKDKVQDKQKLYGIYGTGEHVINMDVSSGVIEIK
ncbi:DUF4097 family beta strand repeat-containing protein [Niallia sp. Krafla_26]|uniref:DUF4097 family beta strand repeat-containing protein n=1 Tax=Niallia sp. Krafla_26 TaxID=3064703 RepID=UPI003D183072